MPNKTIKFTVTEAENIQIQKQADMLFLRTSSFAKMRALGVKLEAPEIVYIRSEPVEVIKKEVVNTEFLETDEREMFQQLVNMIRDDGYMNLNTAFQKKLKAMVLALLNRDTSTQEEL